MKDFKKKYWARIIPWNKNPCFTDIFSLYGLGLIFPSPKRLWSCILAIAPRTTFWMRTAALYLWLWRNRLVPFCEKTWKKPRGPQPKKTQKSGKWILKMRFTFCFGAVFIRNAWWDELKWIRFGGYSNRTPAVWTRVIHSLIHPLPLLSTIDFLPWFHHVSPCLGHSTKARRAA